MSAESPLALLRRTEKAAREVQRAITGFASAVSDVREAREKKVSPAELDRAVGYATLHMVEATKGLQEDCDVMLESWGQALAALKAECGL